MYVYYCIEMVININISIIYYYVIVILNCKNYNELYNIYILIGI